VRKSSIAKHDRGGPGSSLRLAIGQELRRRRVEAGLTQAALGDPFTRAFVSAVESGQAVPSITALALLVDRLGAPLTDFFSGVNDQMTGVYNAGHGADPNPSPRRGR
jgi:transcriptional regulator with XRE-family HTH domain